MWGRRDARKRHKRHITALTCFLVDVEREKGIPPLLYSVEVLQCCSLKLFCGKQVTSSVGVKKGKGKCCYWRKVASEKKLFEIHGVEWFYMTKQLHYKTPLASLERHQMYKDDLFPDFNCLIILAAPKRSCRIKLISLWQSRCCSTLGWATFSWHPHQASHSLEQKKHRRWERISFPPRND